MKRWALYPAMLLSVMLLLPGPSSADEKMTGRIVLHYTKSETIEVGDNVPGHILGVAQQAGLVLWSTGEVSRKTSTFTFDLVKGKGTFSEYSVITDQDGSTLISKASGSAGPAGDGKKFVIEGRIECLGGTGKHDGLKGTGTFKGERVGELKAGADAYYDFTLDCRKS